MVNPKSGRANLDLGMPTAATTELFDYIERLQSCSSIDLTWREIRKFAAHQGIARIGCVYAALRPGKPLNKPFVRGTLSPAIGKRWVTDRLYLSDPIVARALSSPKPFCWGAEYLGSRQLADDVRAFYEGIRDDGAGSLYVIPMRCDPSRGLGLGLLGSDMRRDQFDAFLAEKAIVLTMAVLYADQRMVTLSRAENAPGASLAPRETQCLELLTSGLKNEVIAQHMGITVHTVQLHLASAKKKLGAATREQALAKALTFRLIRSSEPVHIASPRQSRTVS
jgi:DNA-binding CsgD family transcriptional regulator